MQKTIVAAALFASLLLGGCAASPQPEPSSTPAAEQADTQETAAAPEATATEQTGTEQAGSDAAESGYDVRVVHEDAEETVMLLDREHVALAAGTELTADAIDEILATLSDEAVWEADTITQPHAQQIANAFSGERDRARGVLRAMLDNPTAQMKLYVRHAGGESFAHVEVGN